MKYTGRGERERENKRRAFKKSISKKISWKSFFSFREKNTVKVSQCNTIKVSTNLKK